MRMLNILLFILSGFSVALLFLVYIIFIIIFFSKLLKEKHPDIFEKYKLRYSIQKGKVVSWIDFFTKPDKFETLEPKELREKYKLAIKACKFTFYSFFLIILLTFIK